MSSWSGSKLFDTLIVFLKKFLRKLILKKNVRRQRGNKSMKNYPVCKDLKKQFDQGLHYLQLWVNDSNLLAYQNISDHCNLETCFVWFTPQSTIFQFCPDRSSWVEPGLSLAQGHNQWCRWGSKPTTPWSRVKNSTTEPLLSHLWRPVKILRTSLIVCQVFFLNHTCTKIQINTNFKHKLVSIGMFLSIIWVL